MPAGVGELSFQYHIGGIINKRIITLVLLGAAVLFGLSHCNPWNIALQLMTQSYQPVEATVVAVAPDDSDPTISYAYTFDGAFTINEKFSHVTRDAYFGFDSVVGDRIAGAAITAYVNPKDPSQSILTRGLSTSALFSFVWLSGVSLGFLIFSCQMISENTSIGDLKNKLVNVQNAKTGFCGYGWCPVTSLHSR